MVADINFLLVGNTRLHWARYSQNESKFFHTNKEFKVPENINLDQLIWSSVGKLPNFLLKDENEIKTKDIQLENLPDYFGVDRALACLAALNIIENPLNKDLLIADFGTILSITKLNANGTIIGGQLIQNKWERLWSSIFHSISAYNNAGFSLWSNSLQDYRSNLLVNIVFVFLIVMGGLGWRVIDDIWSNKKNLSYNKLSLHSRLVIRTSFSLILFGSLGFFITESFLNSQFFNDLNLFEKLLSSIFETVSARTAGFTNYPISLNSISDTGLLLLMTLMFIGASTGGTGGGIKTTTFIALMAATRSTLRGQKDVIISNRLISDKVILKAVGITVGSLLFVLLMAMLLSTTNTFLKKESFTFLEILFTCISAFATVGFDIGLTAKLNHFGQFILIVGMFVGRLGILLLLSALWQALYKSRIDRQKRIGYPRADLYV